MFSQFEHEGVLYESIDVHHHLLSSSSSENLLTDRYKIGLLQARFSILSTIVLPCDETKIICLN